MSTCEKCDGYGMYGSGAGGTHHEVVCDCPGGELWQENQELRHKLEKAMAPAPAAKAEPGPNHYQPIAPTGDIIWTSAKPGDPLPKLTLADMQRAYDAIGEAACQDPKPTVYMLRDEWMHLAIKGQSFDAIVMDDIALPGVLEPVRAWREPSDPFPPRPAPEPSQAVPCHAQDIGWWECPCLQCQDEREAAPPPPGYAEHIETSHWLMGLRDRAEPTRKPVARPRQSKAHGGRFENPLLRKGSYGPFRGLV